jgi:hypothetical protein
VLVALTGTPHDEAALRLAARIGARHGAAFTVVGVVRPGGSVSRVQMPASVHGVRVIESASPIDALVQEAASHDLTVLGVAEGWQREPSVFGVRSEGVVARCPSSLLVVCGLAERNAAAA